MDGNNRRSFSGIKADTVATILLLAIGVAFILTGILRGEAELIFKRAVNICLECIGIG